MLSAFTDILHVPNLSRGDHVSSVARVSNVLSPAGVAQLQTQLAGRSANIGNKIIIVLKDQLFYCFGYGPSL